MAVDAFGLDVVKSANNLRHFTALEGRGEVIKFKDFTLIDDSYNANPLSMREAIRNFNAMTGKKLAIIGDMKELGAISKKSHEEIYSTEIASNIDSFVLCGSEMSYLWPLLPKEKQLAFYEDYHELKKDLINLIKGYNYILIKSSFGTGLINIVKEIKGYYV
jgi:UDP-N-acetylmuramoyl-tripeptide--D-alanyl-D-alanine ligase